MGWIKHKACWSAVFLLLSGCVHEYTPTDYDQRICMVVNNNWGWAHSLASASKVYQMSPGLILSVIYHESSFNSHARPPREKIWGLIPWRQSSAYGYGQVKDETWAWYIEKNPARFVSRTSFHDTVHFIGWYYSVFKHKERHSDTPYADFYIAYHDGIGGYERHSEKNNTWLQNKAKSVSDRALAYDKQLKHCL